MTDATPDEPDSELTASDVWFHFALGLLLAVFVRTCTASTTPDPLDDLRQRVAHLEGKASR